MEQENYATFSYVPDLSKVETYIKMTGTVSQFFDDNLGDLAKKHDKFLTSLTVADLAVGGKCQIFENEWVKATEIVAEADKKDKSEWIKASDVAKENKNNEWIKASDIVNENKNNEWVKASDITDEKEWVKAIDNAKRNAALNRDEWVKIVSGMEIKQLRMFALLTLYRNSGISVLHVSALNQIYDNVIFDYTNQSNHSYNVDNLNKLLFHILIIARIMRYYDELFSYGLINFVQRDNLNSLISSGRDQNLFRISFSQLGNIVHSQLSDGISHKLIGVQCAKNVKIHGYEQYKGKTLHCDSISIPIMDKKDVIRYIRSHSKVYNVYGNPHIIDSAFENHAYIKIANENKYSGVKNVKFNSPL